MKKNTTKILIGVGLIGVAAYLYFKSKPTQKTFVRKKNQTGVESTLEAIDSIPKPREYNVADCKCSDNTPHPTIAGHVQCCKRQNHSRNVIKVVDDCSECRRGSKGDDFGYEYVLENI